MKNIILVLFAILFCASVIASTVNWRLYTKDGTHSVSLPKTIWVSEIDGAQIIFVDNDGEGVFSNGIAFTYYPPVFRSNGMTTTPDEPTFMEMAVDGKKINTIKLIVLGGKEILVDKRGIKYFKQEKKKKRLFK